MIDIFPNRGEYQRFEIYATGLVSNEQNLADAFSKLNAIGALTKLLNIFKDETIVLQ